MKTKKKTPGGNSRKPGAAPSVPPATPPAAAVEGVQFYALPEPIRDAAISVLMSELPMAKARGLVEALEKLQPVVIQAGKPSA